MTVSLAAASASQIDWHLLFNRIFNGSPVFWGALLATVYISVCAEVLGIILGIITMGASRSRVLPVRWLAWLYRLVMRGTPPIVQIFFIYYGANLLLGFDLFPTNLTIGSLTISGAIIAGIVALGLNEGAFMSEIIRGGVDAIEAGQLEAALSVGMTRRQAMRKIIAPQAARVIIPTIGNQYNYMLKATSLLSFIGVYEMFQDAQVGYSATFQPVEYFLGVAIWYLVLTSVWGVIQSRIEKKLGASDYENIGDRRLWKPWKSNGKPVLVEHQTQELERSGV
ncbi:MAG: amino acid ABC transporter permease [Jatrophihabitantaceae bacterium]